MIIPKEFNFASSDCYTCYSASDCCVKSMKTGMIQNTAVFMLLFLKMPAVMACPQVSFERRWSGSCEDASSQAVELSGGHCAQC